MSYRGGLVKKGRQFATVSGFALLLFRPLRAKDEAVFAKGDEMPNGLTKCLIYREKADGRGNK